MLAGKSLVQGSSLTHRGCGVCLSALNDFGGVWAVGGVRCNNISCGKDNWSWACSSKAGAVVSSPGVGSTSQSGHSNDSRLHCDLFGLICWLEEKIWVLETVIKRL